MLHLCHFYVDRYLYKNHHNISSCITKHPRGEILVDALNCINPRKIIRDESVLFSNHSEDLFFIRDEEEKIISALKPISERNRCENLFVHGPTGSGKTPIIKSAIRQIGGLSRSVIPLYVNCWHYSTSTAIYVKIADALGAPVSRKGRATDEIFDSILERMRYDNTAVLLVLDDLEGLVSKGDTRLLHNLARVANNCARFGVIGISKDKSTLNKIDPGILESLRFMEIEIKGYSKEQLLELLKMRADKGLVEGSYCDELLDKIAQKGIENEGNGRLVLEILRRSAIRAEQQGRTQLLHEDIDSVATWLCSKQGALSDEEQLIVNILKFGERTTSEVYWHFFKKLLRSKRQIRNYVCALEAKGIIESKPIYDKTKRLSSKTIKLSERWQHG